MVFGGHVLQTLIPEVEEEVAGRTGKAHDALIPQGGAVPIRGRRRHLVGTTSFNACFFINSETIDNSKRRADNNLELQMSPPLFLGLKVQSTCRAGKQLCGASVQVDGGVARRVVEPTDEMFHCNICV